MMREKGMKRTDRMRRMMRTMREHLLKEEIQGVKRTVVPVPSSFLRYAPSMIFIQ